MPTLQNLSHQSRRMSRGVYFHPPETLARQWQRQARVLRKIIRRHRLLELRIRSGSRSKLNLGARGVIWRSLVAFVTRPWARFASTPKKPGFNPVTDPTISATRTAGTSVPEASLAKVSRIPTESAQFPGPGGAASTSEPCQLLTSGERLRKGIVPTTSIK